MTLDSEKTLERISGVRSTVNYSDTFCRNTLHSRGITALPVTSRIGAKGEILRTGQGRNGAGIRSGYSCPFFISSKLFLLPEALSALR